MSEALSAHPVGGVDYPLTFQELLEWFPDDAACLAYLERLRWLGGVRLPGLRRGRWVADGESQVDVHRLRSADVGDRRNYLSPDPDTAVDVVCRDLVSHLAEERHVRPRPAAGAGIRVLRDRHGRGCRSCAGRWSARNGSCCPVSWNSTRCSWATNPAAGPAARRTAPPR